MRLYCVVRVLIGVPGVASISYFPLVAHQHQHQQGQGRARVGTGTGTVLVQTDRQTDRGTYSDRSFCLCPACVLPVNIILPYRDKKYQGNRAVLRINI